MSEFKVGDRVRTTGGGYAGKEGYIGVVRDSDYCTVVFDEGHPHMHDGDIGKDGRCWHETNRNIELISRAIPSVGDRVRCTAQSSGVKYGYLGTVRDNEGSGRECILVEWDLDVSGHYDRGIEKGHAWWMRIESLEKTTLSKPSTPTTLVEPKPDYKVGDRVEAIKANERVIVGDVGAIVFVRGDLAYVHWDRHIDGHSCDGRCPLGYGRNLRFNGLKPSSSSAPTQTAGDKIVLGSMIRTKVQKENIPSGSICKITDLDTDSLPYYAVQLSTGRAAWYRTDQVELYVAETAKPPESKYAFDTSVPEREIRRTSEYFVEKDGGCGSVACQYCPTGPGGSCPPKEIRIGIAKDWLRDNPKTDPKPRETESREATFNVGDRVQCTGRADGKSSVVSEFGTVRRLSSSVVGVEWDKHIHGHAGGSLGTYGKVGHCWNVPPKSLRHTGIQAPIEVVHDFNDALTPRQAKASAERFVAQSGSCKGMDCNTCLVEDTAWGCDGPDALKAAREWLKQNPHVKLEWDHKFNEDEEAEELRESAESIVSKGSCIGVDDCDECIFGDVCKLEDGEPDSSSGTPEAKAGAEKWLRENPQRPKRVTPPPRIPYDQVWIETESELTQFEDYLNSKGIKWLSGHTLRSQPYFRTGIGYKVEARLGRGFEKKECMTLREFLNYHCPSGFVTSLRSESMPTSDSIVEKKKVGKTKALSKVVIEED